MTNRRGQKRVGLVNILCLFFFLVLHHIHTVTHTYVKALLNTNLSLRIKYITFKH